VHAGARQVSGQEPVPYRTAGRPHDRHRPHRQHHRRLDAADAAVPMMARGAGAEAGPNSQLSMSLLIANTNCAIRFGGSETLHRMMSMVFR